MANTYLHGVYANVGETYAENAVQSGIFPCYFGTAPVNLVRDHANKGIVNSPVKLTQAAQAKATIGYAADWASFTLCEVLKMHFENPKGNVGPIYVVNVLDPDKHKKEEKATQSLTFVNGRAEFVSSTIILDTLGIEDKAEGVDYSLDYDYTAGKVIMRDLKGELGTASVTYEEVDPAKVQAADIVGGVTAEGERTGIGALAVIGIRDYVHPFYLAAPGWSHLPEVRNALLSAAGNINGKFQALVATDIPVEDEDGGAGNITAALAWKEEKNYLNEREILCWPKGIDNEGNIYHASTGFLWAQQTVDFTHDSVPFESASNKETPFARQYFGAESKNTGFDELSANDLNAKGVVTFIPRGNKVVFWGLHPSLYAYGATSDAKEIFVVNIAMLSHLCNDFLLEFADDIARPMTPQKKDEIINREQNKLNALRSQGALIGKPKIVFLQSDNSTADMLNGDFQFRDIVTVTPPLKSLTATVHYSSEGFSSFFSATSNAE